MQISSDGVVGFSFFQFLVQSSDSKLKNRKIKANDNDNDEDEDEDLVVIIMLRTTQSKKIRRRGSMRFKIVPRSRGTEKEFWVRSSFDDVRRGSTAAVDPST